MKEVTRHTHAVSFRSTRSKSSYRRQTGQRQPFFRIRGGVESALFQSNPSARWKFIPRPRCARRHYKLGSLSQYFPHQLVIIHDEREHWLRQRLAKKSIIGISPFCYLSRCQLARRSRWRWRNSDTTRTPIPQQLQFCTQRIVFFGIFHTPALS